MYFCPLMCGTNKTDKKNSLKMDFDVSSLMRLFVTLRVIVIVLRLY